MLRKSLREANLDKEAALQEQHRKYENNRRDIIAFYDEREKRMLEEFNGTVTKLQDIMTAAMKQREEQLCDCWKEMMRAQEGKHAEIVKELCLLREREERDFKMRTAAVEQESQRLSEQYRSEMMLLEQRHGEREQQILGDLVRRERALDEREQRLRAQQSQNEQDLKVALLANEAEYKARYERAIEDIRESFGKEREEMLSFFRSRCKSCRSCIGKMNGNWSACIARRNERWLNGIVLPGTRWTIVNQIWTSAV
ncbi:hypothetical protein, conserved [Trypanosoma vivax Y486]|uniref:Uncharacterized protein n=1 Tax=Trypanosoma vivax (strain Y486) TaxID=1055687 RepID=F9WQN1_TRYVY|nr:hypothetical protein, conserved [Trypanosoma vivax Y486]|eukprot:CCD19861.1 hypothetical protein, conserved [Trypanosoma vivax Y486]